MKSRLGRLVGMIGATAMLATSMAVLAPAAEADSRCNKRDHTHGIAWWQRTDNYIGNTNSAKGKSYRDYHHTNSDPTSCRV